MHDNVQKLLKKIDRRQLTNNTQRALYALLTSKQEWVSRKNIKVPSVGSRLRELRKPEFGKFEIECASATQLGRTTNDTHSTYYRINPSSVTLSKVTKVFKGVIANSNG